MQPDGSQTVAPTQADTADDLRIRFTFKGLGTTRSTGELICILLALEAPGLRAKVLSHVMQQLGVPLEDIEEERTPPCSRCWMPRRNCKCEVSHA